MTNVEATSEKLAWNSSVKASLNMISSAKVVSNLDPSDSSAGAAPWEVFNLNYFVKLRM